MPTNESTAPPPPRPPRPPRRRRRRDRRGGRRRSSRGWRRSGTTSGGRSRFTRSSRVTPLAGNPPGEFQIDYKLRTLEQDAAGQLVFVDECSVHLWLPPQFPLAAPVARPMTKVFHPNVSDEGIHLAPPWNPASGTLADVVARCGHMLAFQIYDPSNVQNVPALQWVMRYSHLVPTDPDMVLRADGGGDALRQDVAVGRADARPPPRRAHRDVPEPARRQAGHGPAGGPGTRRTGEQRARRLRRPGRTGAPSHDGGGAERVGAVDDAAPVDLGRPAVAAAHARADGRDRWRRCGRRTPRSPTRSASSTGWSTPSRRPTRWRPSPGCRW